MKTEDVLNKRLQQRVGKTNPFAVPEGYFEQLPQRVMALIPETDSKEASTFEDDVGICGGSLLRRANLYICLLFI